MAMELSVANQQDVRSMLKDRFGRIRSEDQYHREALAQICRHAAGLMCPIDARSLKQAIIAPLQSVGYEDLSEPLTNVIETLVTVGDMLELEELAIRETRRNREVLLYTAPPHFVPLSSSRYLLLGIAPDDVPIYPEEITREIQFNDCLRILPGNTEEDIESQLLELGVFKVSAETWLKAPPPKPPEAYIDEFNRRIDRAGRAGEVSDLLIIDPDRNSRYYKGRWREAGNSTGRFVGKRSRAFGGPLCCYIELNNGRPSKLLDLPVGSSDERSWDQAWRLQAALDSINGKSQQIALQRSGDDFVIVSVFSPIPMWLERRWDAVGHRIQLKGSLISYQMNVAEAENEAQFAEARMWLDVTKTAG